MKKIINALACVVFLSLSFNAHAAETARHEGLENVQIGRVVWDISMSDPKKLLPNFRVMRQTYDDLEKRNIKPEMVFAFRGSVVKFLSEDLSNVAAEDRQAVEGIQQIVKDIGSRKGISVLACGLSTKAMGVNESLLPEIATVSNSFLTLIGYQTKGYALIAIQ
jgi:intracellular sulfur oxidation DsrE/DsrF family protein